MTENKKESVYERLSKIDVGPFLEEAGQATNRKTGEKTSLNYLPWAKAWGLVKSAYPTANYTILEYPNYITVGGHVEQAGTLDYRITKVGCEVGATVTINGESYTQRLYPMDKRNNPITDPDIADINKAQLRALVKALAIAGLGLNVYAGEDLPSNIDTTPQRKSMPLSQTSSVSVDFYKTYPLKELEGYQVLYRGENAKSVPTNMKIMYRAVERKEKGALRWLATLSEKDKAIYEAMSEKLSQLKRATSVDEAVKKIENTKK